MPGRIHIYTGDGKGKTTAAVGLAVRAVGAGRRVAFIQFDKGFEPPHEHYSERRLLRQLPEVDLIATGCERMNLDGTFRFTVTEADRAEARRALQAAREALTKGDYFLIVLDEILSAASCGLITHNDVERIMALHRENPASELVLTGRGATPSEIAAADLVTEMVARKHYFDKGEQAREGIDF